MSWKSFLVVFLETLTVSDVRLLPRTFARVHRLVFVVPVCACLPISSVFHHVEDLHKPDQAETLGPFFFLHTLLFVISATAPPPPALVSSIPYKKKREMGSYGGNYFWEPRPVIHPSTTSPPTQLHPSTPPHTYTHTHFNTTTQCALKREGENPLCLNPPFKQKTSSDLERPTTLLSCVYVHIYLCVCVCVFRSFPLPLCNRALGYFQQ